MAEKLDPCYDWIYKDATQHALVQKIFIINLPFAHNRRKYMLQQLEKLNIPDTAYEFVSAVNGQQWMPRCDPSVSKCHEPGLPWPMDLNWVATRLYHKRWGQEAFDMLS